jgi:hypothetical protein
MKIDPAYVSQEKLIADVCQQSLALFPALKDAKSVLVFQIPIGQVGDSELGKLGRTYDKHAIVSKTNIAEPGNAGIASVIDAGSMIGPRDRYSSPEFLPPPLIEVLHVSNEATIISYSFQTDDAAIWIGHQLEKTVLTTVRVQDAAKMAANTVQGWKCDYCEQLNGPEDKKCINCGASRQH